MRITLETTLLADPNMALGRVGPRGLSLNGQQIVEDAQFFRAAAASHFARENFSTVLQFSVARLFSSLKAAERFALIHSGSLPRRGTVTAVCGEEGDTESVYLRGAVLESAVVTEHAGAAVTVQYTIKGGAWTTDVPEDLPGEPDDGEGVFIVMRGNRVAIAAAATVVAVVFSSPMASVRAITFHIAVPTGGEAIGATLLEDTISNAGFSVRLDAETPNDDYVLHYTAFE